MRRFDRPLLVIPDAVRPASESWIESTHQAQRIYLPLVVEPGRATDGSALARPRCVTVNVDGDALTWIVTRSLPSTLAAAVADAPADFTARPSMRNSGFISLRTVGEDASRQPWLSLDILLEQSAACHAVLLSPRGADDAARPYNCPFVPTQHRWTPHPIPVPHFAAASPTAACLRCPKKTRCEPRV